MRQFSDEDLVVLAAAGFTTAGPARATFEYEPTAHIATIMPGPRGNGYTATVVGPRGVVANGDFTDLARAIGAARVGCGVRGATWPPTTEEEIAANTAAMRAAGALPPYPTAPAHYHAALTAMGWRVVGSGHRMRARYELPFGGGTFAIIYDGTGRFVFWQTQWQPAPGGATCWEHAMPTTPSGAVTTVREGFLAAVGAIANRMVNMG